MRCSFGWSTYSGQTTSKGILDVILIMIAFGSISWIFQNFFKYYHRLWFESIRFLTLYISWILIVGYPLQIKRFHNPREASQKGTVTFCIVKDIFSKGNLKPSILFI